MKNLFKKCARGISAAALAVMALVTGGMAVLAGGGGSGVNSILEDVFDADVIVGAVTSAIVPIAGVLVGLIGVGVVLFLLFKSPSIIRGMLNGWVR